jgi:hypothetical protein
VAQDLQYRIAVASLLAIEIAAERIGKLLLSQQMAAFRDLTGDGGGRAGENLDPHTCHSFIVAGRRRCRLAANSICKGREFRGVTTISRIILKWCDSLVMKR